jgi:hypothetical protein
MELWLPLGMIVLEISMLLSIPCTSLQVCLHCASNIAAKQMGVVMYLDTSNSFSPSRVATIIYGISDLFGQRGS